MNLPFEAPFEQNNNAKTSQIDYRILVADDDPLARTSLTMVLQRAGYQVIEVSDGQSAIDAFADDVIVGFFDLFMPHASGQQCLEHAKQYFPDMQVVMISASGEISDAVAAMKHGACEYLTKPFVPSDVLESADRAIRIAKLSRDNRALKAAVGHPLPAKAIVASASGQSLVRKLNKIASVDSTVLLTGESGTGKSTLARMIHQSGARAEAPFVVVNCASLPRDLIESELFGHSRGAFTGAVNDRPGRAEVADGGTLFLDEIGDLPLELQPKLLTFLQDRTLQRVGSNTVRKVDVRVIAATHQDLESMCAQKHFREDLYYRLNVLNLDAAPLRERLDEIPEFAESILQRIGRRSGKTPLQISPSGIWMLQQHQWPGNIRELENTLERACAFCEGDVIQDRDLEVRPRLNSADDSEETAQPVPALAGLTLSEIEVRAIIETLQSCGGNKAKTARVLGISEKSIYNKMKRHGLRR